MSSPVYLLKGSDDILRGEALTRLLDELVAGGDRSLLVDEFDLDEALAGLSAVLAARKFDASLASSIGEPLTTLRDSIEGVVVPSKAAALPGRARKAVKVMEDAIPVPSDEKVGEKKKRRTIRLVDGAGATVVTTVPEWEPIVQDLDAQVRKLLDEGYEVELS